MWNARQHGRIFGRSIFKVFGRILEWFHGKKLAITTAVLLALAGIVAAMTLIRLPYPVEADGKLMPVEQYAVFAPWEGKIEKVNIFVKPDANGVVAVEKGQKLIQLVNKDLDLQIEEAGDEFEKARELLKQTRNQLNSPRGGDEQQRKAEEHRLRIEVIQYEADMEIATRRKERLIDRRDKELVVLAPESGIIPDFKRLEILRERPVQAGDHLFDVMNPDGEWHMELLVSEKRMGHINDAIQTQSPSGEPNLKGQFTLRSEVESKFDCVLQKVATRSTTDPEEGTVLELIAVAVEGTELPRQQIGTEVTARFECNDCTLAFWCFGDVVEFVQRNLWWF